MANGINNKYSYRSGLLDSLKVQHTASDVRNEDEYRKKVLNGLGVEYTEDDINQKNLYRAKVVEGLASSGGGGESDFSTAEVTINLAPPEGITFMETALENLRTEYPNEDFSYTCNYLPSINNKCSVLLYQGRAIVDGVKGTAENYLEYNVIIGTPITTGGVTWNSEDNIFEITGDGTITASVSNTIQ